MHVGPGWMVFFLTTVAYCQHFFEFWDTIHTREIYLGPISITEAQLLIMAVHIINIFAGPVFWTQELPGVQSVLESVSAPIVGSRAAGAPSPLFGNSPLRLNEVVVVVVGGLEVLAGVSGSVSRVYARLTQRSKGLSSGEDCLLLVLL